MKEPEQELSMMHISTGMWMMGIDLVHDEQIVTKNPLGIFQLTGEENLYHAVEKEAEMVEENEIREAAVVMKKVEELASSLGVPTEEFIAAIKELRYVVPQEHGGN